MRFAFIWVFVLFSFCSGYADLCPSNWRKGEPLKAETFNPSLSQAVDLDIECPMNLFTSANFILWVPKEHGLELAFDQAFDPEIFPSTVDSISYDYKPGFSVSLAYLFERDSWSFTVDYLRLHFSKNGHADSHFGLSTLQPIWLAKKDQMARARSHWRLKMDRIDGVWGRNYYFGEKLTLNTKIGLRSLFLNQKYAVLYTTAFDYEDIFSHNISRSWALGPLASCNTSFLLGAGLSFQTNLSASLALQKFHTQVRESNYNDRTSIQNFLKNRFIQVTPIFESSIGLAWNTLFARDRFYFELFSGYNWLFLSSQNALRKLHDTLPTNRTGDFGELMFHGLTFSLLFAF